MQIRCPECDFSREVEESSLAPDLTVATCPKCKTRFSFRDKEEFVLEPEESVQPAPEVQHPPSVTSESHREAEEIQPESPETPESMDQHSMEEPQERPWEGQQFSSEEQNEEFDASEFQEDKFHVPDVPWTRAHELGFFPAFIETVKGVMFSPGYLFYGMRIDTAFQKAFGFYMLASVLGMLISTMWDMTIGNPFFGPVPQQNMGDVLTQLIISPLLFTLALYLLTGFMHLILLLAGSGRAGFGATLRVIAYCSALNVLYIIPIIGPIVASLWSLYAMCLGFRSAHRSSFGRVLPAVLILALIQLTIAYYILQAIGMQ